MAEAYIVRHGQASFGAANYDKLSPLGIQQSMWLGEYFKKLNLEFDHILTGRLVRHHETALGICQGLGLSTTAFDTHAGLNEFSFEGLARAYLEQHPEERLAEKPEVVDFYRLLKKALLAWTTNDLSGVDETWSQFESRITDALGYIQSLHQKKRVLVVTSGGAMGMMTKVVLQTPPEMMIEINLQTKNTGLMHCFFNQQNFRLASLNETPHLEPFGRQASVTYS